MAERDPEFMQDVLRILYAALADREALAAAMSGQQPMPVPDAAPGQPAQSGSSPTEAGVQGGAPFTLPRPIAFLCGTTIHVDNEDLALDSAAEANVQKIVSGTAATREQVVQELVRRALQAEIAGLMSDLGIS